LGATIFPADNTSSAARSRQRRGLLRAQTFGNGRRDSKPRVHTQAFVALLAVGIAGVLGAGSLTSFVSAGTPDLHVAMPSLPGLPANAEWVEVRPIATPLAMVSTTTTPASEHAPADTASVEHSSGLPELPASPLPTPASESAITAALANPESASSEVQSAAEGAEPASDATSGEAAESASEQRTAALEDSGDAEESKSDAPKAPPPLYQSYTVQIGDTVTGIAGRFGVRTEDIIANNMGVISEGSLLVVGSSLQIPTVPGILHNVSVGETLVDIAAAYGVTLEDILSFPGNQIADPSNVLQGTQILVVKGRLPEPPPEEILAAAEVANEATPEPTQAPTPEPTPTPPPPPLFVWPVQGRITSYFGPSHPKGIDISIAYAPVAASRAGTVVFAGGDPCCSYGYYIDIQHADGYLTRYGHLSKFLVQLGQEVAQGETIAISGNTGYSTGAHVHFEIRQNGAFQDPLQLLP